MTNPRFLLRIASLLYAVYFIASSIGSGFSLIKSLIFILLACSGWGIWSGLFLFIGLLMLYDVVLSLSLGHTGDLHGRSGQSREIQRAAEPALFWTTVLCKLLISCLATGHVLFTDWKERNRKQDD